MEDKSKTIEVQGRGTVICLIKDKGYGFIGSANGDQIYFHAQGVCYPKFEDLKEGNLVEYVEVSVNAGKTKAVSVTRFANSVYDNTGGRV